jgi:hypothetical protein
MNRPAATVVGVANVASLALAANDSWARTVDGHVFHWGRHGQGYAVEVPVPAHGITALTADDQGSACVLAEAGSVWCWSPRTPVFRRIHDAGIVAIAAEDRDLLALRPDLAVVRTRLDPDPPGQELVEQPPPAPPGTVALSARSYRFCALSKTGTVACGKGWLPVPGVTHATQVVDAYQSCALQAGAVTCWGYQGDADTPTLVPGPPVKDAIDIARTTDEVCAVRARGRVTCWGHRGEHELLASGAIDLELGPMVFPDPDYDAGYISGGGPFGCAVMTDRSVTCWGTNSGGELGDGSIAFSTTPLGVPGL